MASTGGRGVPEAWLLRLRTLGPGAVRPQEYRARKASRQAGQTGRPEKPPRRPAAGLDPNGRKRVAQALAATFETYPVGLVAAQVGAQDIDLIVRGPASDLSLVADLVKRRLMAPMREAGMPGRIWRKGFLRRALGNEGEVRRALVALRRESRTGRTELIDRVRHDESLGVRPRRRPRPIEQPPTNG